MAGGTTAQLKVKQQQYSRAFKEKIMCWKFNMIYNPGKMQNAADAISRCKPLHMMYISASQQQASSRSDDVKKILEVDMKAD